MSAPNDAGSAFPQPHMRAEPSDGMSLRDYFAAKALPALLVGEVEMETWWYAKRAYELADAMLKARAS